MIDEKEFSILLDDGVTYKTYIFSKFPATSGREIICKYPLSSLPKVGDYESNKETMLKLMSFVQVQLDSGLKISLSTQSLVDNHVPSWETLMKIERSMLEYNCSFFRNGWVSNFLEDLAEKLPDWITKMLMPLLQKLSTMEQRPGTN